MMAARAWLRILGGSQLRSCASPLFTFSNNLALPAQEGMQGKGTLSPVALRTVLEDLPNLPFKEDQDPG